jgi:hypothetical protein
MEVQTTYDSRTLTAMARALRKTIRRGRSIAVHIFAWVVIALCVFLEIGLFLIGEFALDGRTVFTILAVLVLLCVIILEDRLNGWVASRQMLPGTREAQTVFTEDGYVMTTQAAETHWRYQNIQQVCETKDYFVFLLDKKHGQAFDKARFTQGTPEEFRTFITEKTGKTIEFIK